MRARAIDFHCHAVCHAADELMASATQSGTETSLRHASADTVAINLRNREALDAKLTTAEARLADMESSRVDIQVISPTPRQYFYSAPPELGLALAQLVNDDVARLVAAKPDRFVGLGTVPLQEPRLAVRELRRAVGELGLRGIEIGTHVDGRELDDPSLEVFYRAAQELDVVLFMHPSGFSEGRRLTRYYLNNVIGNPLESTIALGHLIFGGVLERHPALKLCVAHGGGFLPSYPGRFEHAFRSRAECSKQAPRPPGEYLRRVHFDTLVFDRGHLRHLVDTYGAERLVMGSDYPYDMGEADPVAFIESVAGLDDEARRLLLGGNAARLLKLA